MNLQRVLKALADENRLRILHLLNQKEMCVCELEQVLGITQSNVSRHLAKLRDADLISAEKQGQFVFHFLNRELVREDSFLGQLLNREVAEEKKFLADLERLHALTAKGGLCPRQNCREGRGER